MKMTSKVERMVTGWAAVIILCSSFAFSFSGATDQAYECHSNTRTIIEAEASVRDATSPRIYSLCENTTFHIGSFHSRQKKYVNGMPPLLIFNSNVEIRCGRYGRSEGNCVFTGGGVHSTKEGITSTHQVEVGHVSDDDVAQALNLTHEESINTDNVFLVGITFAKFGLHNSDATAAEAVEKGLEASNVRVRGPTTSTIVTDCIFHDNHAAGGSLIWVEADPLSQKHGVEDAYEDLLEEDELAIFRPSLQVTVRKSVFQGNRGRTEGQHILGGNSVITAVANDAGQANVEVEETIFINNEDFTTLIFGMDSHLWLEANCFADNTVEGDGLVTVTSVRAPVVASTENYAVGLSSSCRGVATSEIESPLSSASCKLFDHSVCLVEKFMQLWNDASSTKEENETKEDMFDAVDPEEDDESSASFVFILVGIIAGAVGIVAIVAVVMGVSLRQTKNTCKSACKSACSAQVANDIPESAARVDAAAAATSSQKSFEAKSSALDAQLA